MKNRNGFVSNSSSGSFIMNWRMKAFGEPVSIKKAVGEAFGAPFKYIAETGELTEEFDWENAWNKEVQAKVEKAIEATELNENGTFTTTFWTSMVNSAEDFGETAKSLVMGLVADEDDRFEIIDKKVEKDC